MTVIGLTGGIASGKSTAADVLRELGASIIDGDRLGHRSYEPGTPGFQKVVNAFGHDIVAKDGTIDRRVLGGKVFGAPGQLERLNAIVWPEIRTLIIEEIRQIRAQEPDPIIVIEAAVLLEAKWQDLCDEVWVVTTPVETAVARLKSRNGLAEDAAMARINAQMSNKERTDVADVKIENASTEDELRARMERAWKSLQRRLNRKAPPRRPASSTSRVTKTGTVKRTPARATGAKAAPRAAAKPAAKPATKAATGRASAASSAAAATSKAAAKPAAAAAKPTPAKAPASRPSAAKSAPAKPAPAKARSASKAPTAQATSSRGTTTTKKPAVRSGGRAK